MMGEATPLWKHLYAKFPSTVFHASKYGVVIAFLWQSGRGERRCASKSRLVIMNQAPEWSSSRRERQPEQVPPPPA